MKNKHKCFIPVLKGPILPLAPGQSCWTYAYDGRVVILAGLLTFTISIFFPFLSWLQRSQSLLVSCDCSSEKKKIIPTSVAFFKQRHYQMMEVK